MKRFLLGGVALVALGMGAPAIAADMAARPIVRPVAYTNWTGCYVGGTAGNSWGHSDGYSTTASSVTIFNAPRALAPGVPLSSDFNMTGFTGGVYGGCQVQFGVWVIGAEGDWEANNKEGQSFYVGGPSTSTIALANGATGPVPAGAYWSAKERWLATARGRIGYAVDKWLFSVSGGAAWMKIDSAESVTIFGGPAGAFAAGQLATPLLASNVQSDYRLGWTVGASVEYALPYNWSIRSEYLYVQIPSYTTFTPGSYPTALLVPNNVSAGKLTNNIWRAGLAYKFYPIAYR